LDLDLIRIFVKVIQNGSFSKAAELLKLPKSTVSKAVSRFERETGTRLLVRTTRSLTLTAAGRAFYEASLGPVQTLEDARKSLHGHDSRLTGHVRITAPEDLGSAVIAPTIAVLINKHPGLSFELHYTNQVIDLVKEGFDLGVRVGKLGESSLKIKRGGEITLVLVASPTYLKGREKINSPQDLTTHRCLSLSIQSLETRWTLRSAKGTVHIPIKAKISSNQMSSLLQMAIGNGGIALVPLYLAKADLESKKLVRILPDWASPGIPVSILSPLASTSSARLKATIEEIAASLQKALG
jgi:LysR family transcriptional regulator, regulator for bpeEF and oprC